MSDKSTEKQKDEITLRVEEGRLFDLVTVNEMIGMNNGDFQTIRDVLARFVVEDGAYVSYERGLEVVGEMTIRQLMDASSDFVGASEDVTVPKGKDTV
jgi:hypothetical protein